MTLAREKGERKKREKEKTAMFARGKRDGGKDGHV